MDDSQSQDISSWVGRTAFFSARSIEIYDEQNGQAHTQVWRLRTIVYATSNNEDAAMNMSTLCKITQDTQGNQYQITHTQ